MKDVMGPIIYILYLNIISAGKSSRLSWARHGEGLREMINSFKVSLGSSKLSSYVQNLGR